MNVRKSGAYSWSNDISYTISEAVSKLLLGLSQLVRKSLSCHGDKSTYWDLNADG